MKSFLKKYRGFLVLGLMMALLTSVFTVDVGAYAREVTVSSATATAPVISGNKYYLKTEYHVGSQAPYDDAYIYVEAGGDQFLYRDVSYSFGIAHGQRWGDAQRGYSMLIGMVYNNIGYKIPSVDYGEGWGFAHTYPVSGYSYLNIDESQRLTIK